MEEFDARLIEIDELDFHSTHYLLNNLLLASNSLKAANQSLQLKRHVREYLFRAEDQIDGAADTIHQLMHVSFHDDPDYRRWGMQEGWLEPETDKEIDWYEENIGPWNSGVNTESVNDA